MKKNRARQYFAVDTPKKHQKRQGYKGHITTLLIIILPAILTPIFVSVCLP